MATAYGSLDLPAAMPEARPEPPGGLAARRLVVTLVFMVMCVAMFTGGRVLNGNVQHPEYQHSEVFVLDAGCTDGQFVGGCTECHECEEWQYAAGGCSFFKDTFCTMCEPIMRCPQDNVRCTDSDDSRCLECQPGFWDDDCKPCSICDLPSGFYETGACTQTSDTECTQCTQCREGEWMSEQCEYFSDRKCMQCTECVVGNFRALECQLGDNANNLLGADTVCEPCSVCEEDFWVSDICTVLQDTTCTACSPCPCGDRDTCEYITDLCVPGEIFITGSDTVCKDCTRIQDDQWEVFGCGGTSDALFKGCSLCQEGEFEHQACTATADTVCPDCPIVHHCPKEHVRCTTTDDSTCTACSDPFMGPTCCYQKTFGDCGTITSRTRIAFRYGFDGETNDEFVSFCMDLCEEFPDCMAFELMDGGTDLTTSGGNSYLSKESACYFKASYTEKPEKPDFDCYSNICRQGMHESGLVFVD